LLEEGRYDDPVEKGRMAVGNKEEKGEGMTRAIRHERGLWTRRC
jgi:hypothetical protein